MGVTRSEAVKRFLMASTRTDLANLYHKGMEMQVNVAQDGGQRKDSTNSTGVRTVVWTDGVQSWSALRVPKNAMSEPEDNDFELRFELDKHAEGIGMTGWNWQERKSYWMGFDFDTITGHSEKHLAKLSEAQLEAVKEAAIKIPWVTVRKSTGGKGLHLYVFVNGIPTSNHNEHAALARSVLGMMSAITGFDFGGSVDVCGGNMWVWHRKMKGTDGLALVKQGTVLEDVPPNWKDHVKVTSSRGKVRNRPQFIEEREMSIFEELAGQRLKIPLDEEHRKLIDFLAEKKAVWWWDADHHMLVCCSYDLKLAHEKFNMRGLFDTVSTAHDGGLHNCWAFPQRHGAWVVRRYTRGIGETANWDQDQQGFTRTYLNKDPNLQSSARTHGGVEQEKGGFEFKDAKTAIEVAKTLGAKVVVAENLLGRSTVLKLHKDGRMIVKIKRESSDQPLLGWKEEKDGTWTRIYNVVVDAKDQDTEIAGADDLVRHLISETNDDCGWVIKGDHFAWNTEPLVHVKMLLAGPTGFTPKQVGGIMGACIAKPWRLVNKPFQPEYPGDREWNRNSAQLRFAPSSEVDKLSFPHWEKILRHIGSGLDDAISQDKWCQDHNITSGYDYLCLWAAFMFREPLRKVPYLFFYGPQNSGKSIYHEGLALLFDRKRGYMRADAALTSQSAFNGELENAVLCVVEETDLSKQSSSAYNRIKDWTTSDDILIHRKNFTPYTHRSAFHIVQVGNDGAVCPIFMEDTRITMGFVKPFEGEEIPKHQLKVLLEKEAPDFLAHLFSLELPESGKRLALPVINTQDKIDAAKANQTVIQKFFTDLVNPVDGEAIKLADVYMKFKESLDANEREAWTKQAFTKELPANYPKGRFRGADWYIGNISWLPRAVGEPLKPKLVRRGEKLISEGEVNEASS